MKEIAVDLKNNPYKIHIEDNLIDNALPYIKEVYKNKEIYIVSDKRVAAIYLDRLIKGLDGYECKSVVIEGYEKAKSIKVYESVCRKLINLGIRRDHLLIALGGGVIGDLTGFISATLYRGIKYVQIPTSLLAQTDSSIGGKTGIDIPEGKNLLGAFNQPLCVLIDPLTLKTLPKREMICGLAELIKHGMIRNKQILDNLMFKDMVTEDILYDSILVKRDIVINDEFDRGERMLLNFGHTFGHAIEKKTKYKKYNHGEAVALGMLMAVKLGEYLGITPKAVYPELVKIYEQFELPKELLDIKDYLNLIFVDKKNLAGKMHFIIIEQIGKGIIYEIDEKDIMKRLGDY